VNSTLESLQRLTAETQVIRNRAGMPLVDALRACQQLTGVLKTLRQKVSIVKLDRPKLDVEKVWAAFATSNHDLNALDGLQFRTLCSSEKTALQPEFIAALARYPDKLNRSRCLYGIVNSYFSEWRQMKSPVAVESLLTGVFPELWPEKPSRSNVAEQWATLF
jgi:hypothetical protein